MIYLGEHDPLDYFPLLNGVGKASADINQLPFYPCPEKNRIFQIDEKWILYRAEKEQARLDPSKHYQTIDYPTKALDYIIKTLVSEYPEYFVLTSHNGFNELNCKLSNENLFYNENFKLVGYDGEIEYSDLFDALAMQVSEDLVVYKDFTEGHKVASAHVSHKNGWGADSVIGKSYSHINGSGSEKSEGYSNVLVKALLNLGKPIEKFSPVIFKTHCILNCRGDEEHFNPDEPSLFMRLERHTVTSFKDDSSFLMTIKPYIINCSSLDAEKKSKIVTAVNLPQYDHLSLISNYRNQIIRWLKS